MTRLKAPRCAATARHLMLLLWCSQDHDGSTHNQLQTGCLASCRTLISNRRWGMQVIAEGYPRGKKELCSRYCLLSLHASSLPAPSLLLPSLRACDVSLARVCWNVKGELTAGALAHLGGGRGHCRGGSSKSRGHRADVDARRRPRAGAGLHKPRPAAQGATWLPALMRPNAP